MQSFLAKCTAVGIVAGGFTLTGDVGRLADRGRQLLHETDVPKDQAPAQEPAPAAGPSVAVAPATAAPQVSAAPRQPAPPPPAATPSPAPADKPWRLPGDAPADAPVGSPVAARVPVSGGVASVDLRRLAAGDRMFVWLRRPAAAARGDDGSDLIALDIIDPATGEALEHRHAAVSTGPRGPIHAAPRRVLVAVDAAGRLARGDVLRLAPLRGVHGTGPQEDVGRVLALDVQPP
jgi:hypothetical protein